MARMEHFRINGIEESESIESLIENSIHNIDQDQ